LFRIVEYRGFISLALDARGLILDGSSDLVARLRSQLRRDLCACTHYPVFKEPTVSAVRFQPPALVFSLKGF